VDEDPVAWKERCIEGLAPTRLLRRVPAGTGEILTAIFSTAFTIYCVEHQAAMTEAFVGQGVWLILGLGLVVGVRCSNAICGERERQTWDMLLTTPLTSPSIVRSKLHGVMQASRRYLIAYSVPMVLGALLFGWEVLAAVAAIIWFCWIWSRYMAAVGLCCSAFARDSWRSLLATIAVGYGSGMALLLINNCLFSIFWVLALAILSAVETLLGKILQAYFVVLLLAIYLTMTSLVYHLCAKQLLDSATRTILTNDRASPRRLKTPKPT
jgi:hypothetical protein